MYFIDTEKMENEAIETGDKKRGTILIVEDNQEIRHYLSSGLAALFNILEAGNGEEALEKLKNHEADIIITDVMMPVMDGIKLCKNIKQNIRTCHIPVIILSAKTDIKDQLEGLQVGAVIISPSLSPRRPHFQDTEHDAYPPPHAREVRQILGSGTGKDYFQCHGRRVAETRRKHRRRKH